MIFFKKCVCFIGVFCMLSAFPTYAMENDVYTENEMRAYSQNIELLTKLDIIQNEMVYNKTVTREDFAIYIANFLGHKGKYSDKALNSAFSDVTDKNSGAIDLVVNLGIMGGFGDNTFRPDEYITCEHTIKSFVYALGYGYVTQQKSVINVARDIGLLDNIIVNEKEYVTNKILVDLSINSLYVDRMSKTMVGNKEKYEITKNDTILQQVYNVEKLKGIVTAVPTSVLFNQKEVFNGFIMIGDEVYKTNLTTENLLGRNVEFYVKSQNGDKSVIYIGKTQLLNKEIIIDSKNIKSYTSKTYAYYKDEDKQSTANAKLSQNAYIIYNNKNATNLETSEMIPDFGTVSLIDNNLDGLYDVVLLSDKKVFVVKTVSDDKIYLKENINKILDLSIVDKYFIIDSSGKEISINKIKEWDILSVETSKDEKMIKIVVSKKTKDATIESMRFDSKNDKYITLDSVEYKVSEMCIGNDKIVVGNNYNIGISDKNEIVFFRKVVSQKSFGYLINAKTSNALDEKLKFKVFASNGSIVYMDGAERIEIDNLTNQSPKMVIDILKKGTTQNDVYPQLMKYEVNQKGEIFKIDTAYNEYSQTVEPNYLKVAPKNNELKDSLRIIYSSFLSTSGSLKCFKNFNSFGGRTTFSDETIVFEIPQDVNSAKDSDFKIGNLNNLKNEESYSFQAYSDTNDDFMANVMIMRPGVGSTNDYLGIIKKISKGVNSEGEPATHLIIQGPPGITMDVYSDNVDLVKPYYNDGAPATYTLDVGDIVRCNYKDNEAYNIWMLYDSSEDNLVYRNPNVGYGEFQRYFMGNVYSKNNSFINLTSEELDSADIELSYDKLESHDTSGYYIMKCKKNGGSPIITDSYATDIIDYKTNNDNFSKVFVYSSYGYPWIIVIYED